VTPEEYLELIPLYAAGALSPAEAQDVRGFLDSGDPQATRLLHESQATFARLATALPPIDPPAHLKQKLMQRVGMTLRATGGNGATTTADVRRGDDESGRMGKSGFARFMEYAAAAVILMGIGGAVTYFTLGARLKDQLQRTTLALAETQGRLKSMEGVGASNKDVTIVSLASDTTPQARGRVVYGGEGHKAHVYFFDLKPPGTGKVYQLWFITDTSEKMPSQVFTVDHNGDAELVVDMPVDHPLKLAAVTDEPKWMPQPTGQIQLVGQLK